MGPDPDAGDGRRCGDGRRGTGDDRVLHDHGGGFERDVGNGACAFRSTSHGAGSPRPPARAGARGGRGPAAAVRSPSSALRGARRARRARGDQARGERQRVGGPRSRRRRRSAHPQLHRLGGHAQSLRVPLPDRLARGGALRPRAPPRGAGTPVGRGRARRHPSGGGTSRTSTRRATFGVEQLGRTVVPPLAEDLRDRAPAIAGSGAGAVVYLGLGLAARARCRTAHRGNMLPVFANSALMFGYPNPSWTAEWEGWVYCDTVSAGNAELRRVVDTLGLGDAALTPGVPGNYDMGRLLAEGWARAPILTRDGVVEGLERAEDAPGRERAPGTTMGFGQWERSALKGTYLLRAWRWQLGRGRRRRRLSRRPARPAHRVSVAGAVVAERRVALAQRAGEAPRGCCRRSRASPACVPSAHLRPACGCPNACPCTPSAGGRGAC